MKDPVADALAKLLTCSKHWVRVRIALRRAHDSKSATDKDKARLQRELTTASVALEKAVIDLEKVRPGSLQPSKNPVDWGKVAGVVAQLAGGIEKAVSPRPTIIDAEIIDTDGKTV